MRRAPEAGRDDVPYLEPTHAALTIVAGLGCVMAVGLVGAVLVYRRRGWPDELELGVDVPDWLPTVVGGVAALVTVACFIGASYGAWRWWAIAESERPMRDPALRQLLPAAPTPTTDSPANAVGPLAIEVVEAGSRRAPRTPVRQVSSEVNVFGAPPMRIVLLRSFENAPRTRTFLQGPWRELGPVTLLRSGWSMSAAEYDAAGGALDDRFVATSAPLDDLLATAVQGIEPKGRRVIPAVAAQPVLVNDPYGSYPVLGLLCHGTFWRESTDALLSQADLVVVDLAGSTPRHPSDTDELQPVVDLVPFERVVFLADQRSDTEFLAQRIRTAWATMAEGSPNGAATVGTALIAVTDHMPHSHRWGRLLPRRVPLRARRRQTRRLAALVHARARPDHVSSPTASSAVTRDGAPE